MPKLVTGAIGVLVSTGLGLVLASWSLAAGIICLVLAAMLAAVWLIPPLRQWLGLSAAHEKDSGREDCGRVGYRGRPGSTADMRDTRFHESLDTAIDNEGDIRTRDVDVE